MKKTIILVGKPGAGKGTRLSELLSERTDLAEQFEVLSVGNMLRQARKDGTDLGKQAAAYMDSGGLVPDEIINAIVLEGIRSSSKSFFLDGFPRTVEQAKAVLDVYPDLVVEFYVEDEIVIERAAARRVCSQCGETYTTNAFKAPKVEGICDKCGAPLIQRPDDAEDVVRNRLKVYEDQTFPVLNVLIDAGIPAVSIDNTNSETAKKQFFALFEE